MFTIKRVKTKSRSLKKSAFAMHFGVARSSDALHLFDDENEVKNDEKIAKDGNEGKHLLGVDGDAKEGVAACLNVRDKGADGECGEEARDPRHSVLEREGGDPSLPRHVVIDEVDGAARYAREGDGI